MKKNTKNIFKSYMEAYEGYSKCWYMYYTTRTGDKNLTNNINSK